MSRRHPACTALTLALACVANAALARDEPRPIAAAVANAIESCVDNSAIRFVAQDKRALLDPADTGTVGAAIVRRYPMVEHDDLSPQGIVLWRQPKFGWVYVTLLVNPAKAGEVCFTGSFGADRFEMTPSLIDKYFGAAEPR
jgi:hypothetical protein